MAGTGPIDEYVITLRRALRGPRAARRDLLTEARDGLMDAAEAYECAGMGRAEAERLAVEDFGPVPEVAPGYQWELAVGQGRRTAALLFLSVPLTALAWSVIWAIFPSTISTASVRPAWFTLLARSVDCLQLLTGVAGGIALLALGRGLRRLRRSALVTRSLGLFVCLQLPVLAAMCAALTATMQDPVAFSGYTPGIVLTVLSCALAAWQLHSAARCLRVTAAPILGAADGTRSGSRP